MNHDFGPGTGSAQENVSFSRSSEASAVSSMFSLVDKLERLSVNLVNLSQSSGKAQNFTAMKTSAPNTGPTRRFVCFFCDKEGHKKYDCCCIPPTILHRHNSKESTVHLCHTRTLSDNPIRLTRPA
jgi:hypothetical protein